MTLWPHPPQTSPPLQVAPTADALLSHLAVELTALIALPRRGHVAYERRLCEQLSPSSVSNQCWVYPLGATRVL